MCHSVMDAVTICVGVGGMRRYLQFLLAPLFLEVIWSLRKFQKNFLKICSFDGLPPPKKTPILAFLARSWLFESRKGHLLCFSMRYKPLTLIIM